MNRIVCTILTIVGLTIFLACNNPQSQANKLLTQAEQLVENHPDSALLLIDSIFYPEESFSKKDYMRYWVIRIQVRYKNYLPITEDTAIFVARDYFSERIEDNWELSFLGYFYSGCVYREKQQYEYAIRDYKHALHIAEQFNDEKQQAFVFYNIGDLYYDRRSYEQALEYYQKAIDKYEDYYDERLISLQAAAQSALLSGKSDSAFVYFQTGLDLAVENDDIAKKVDFMHDMAVTFLNQKKYEEALSLLYQTKEMNPDTTQLARYYLNLANIYRDNGQKDSLNFYTRKLQQFADEISDIYFQIAANEFLAEVFATDGDYHSAMLHLQTQNNRLKHILIEDNVKALAEADRKYNLAAKETILAREKMRNYRLSLIVSIIGWVLLLIAGMGLYYYKKHQQEREKNYRLQKETEKNAYLNHLYRSFVGNITLFKNYVNDLAVSYALKERNEAIAGYAKIEKAIEDMEAGIYSGYIPVVADFLRSLNLMDNKQVDLLRPEDQLLVTLLYARHEHTQIADLLRITNHALTTRKSRLKEKLLRIGLSEKQISEIFATK